MRRHGSLASFAGVPPSYATRAAGFLLAACAVFGCATTTTPSRVELHSVLSDPGAYHNHRVEIIGRVIDYEPAGGDTYRALHFTLGYGSEEKVFVFGSGYAAAVAKASSLVGDAFRTGEPVMVIGKLKAGKNAELRLESVEHRGRKIDVTRGRRTRPGFDVGGFHVTPSIGINATITP